MDAKEQRRQHLEELIEEAMDLQRDCESKSLTSDHPKEQAQLKKEIQSYKDRLAEYQQELDGLNQPDVVAQYLKFLIDTNTYLDPRGIKRGSGRHSITLPLEEVFVTLNAEREARRAERNRMAHAPDGELLLLDDPYSLGAARTEKIEFDQAVQEHRRLALIGEPGAGKTTLLRFIALRFALAERDGNEQVRDNDGRLLGDARLPIYVRVSSYAEAYAKDNNLHLRDYLPRAFADLSVSPQTLRRLFKDHIAAGRALILLDGLDEVIDLGHRMAIAREIEGFAAAINAGLASGRENRLIVTSRIAGYRESPLGAGFVSLTLNRLELDQIEKILDRWCRAAERFQTPKADAADVERRAKVQTSGLLNSIKNNPGVQRLAENPLMLTCLALNYRNEGRLPHSRIELYELTARTLLEEWELDHGFTEQKIIREVEAIQVLAPLAFWLHENRSDGLASEGVVKEKLTGFLAQRRGLSTDDPNLPTAVDDFLKQVRNRTGLFVERAPGRYGFMHLTFEEYFAARELLRRHRQTTALIHKFRHQPRWAEVTLLAIGFKSKDYPDQAADLIRAAILAEGEEAVEAGYKPSSYEDVLHRDLLFAAQSIGDCEATEPVFRRSVIRRLVNLLFAENAGGKYEPLGKMILGWLAYQRGGDAETDAVDALLAALTTDTAAAAVRWSAADALGSIGSERAVAPLIEILHSTGDSALSAHVAWALGSLAGSRKVTRNPALFKSVAEALLARLSRPGFEKRVLIGDNYFEHEYEAIWEALWNVCQKQGIE